MKAIIKKVCHVSVFFKCPHCEVEDIVAVDTSKMRRKINCENCDQEIDVDIRDNEDMGSIDPKIVWERYNKLVAEGKIKK